MARKRIVRQLIQAFIVLIVAIGIWQAAHKAGQQLHQLQATLAEQVKESELALSKMADPQQRQLMEENIQKLRHSADNFWAASPPYLVASGLLCGLGMFPASWYWRQCLLAMGQQAPPLACHWAYFYGGLGKYFPGKAMVIVIRLSVLSQYGVRKLVATVTIFLETLTMMAVGGASAAICLLLLNIDWRLTALSLGLLAATFLPTLPPILRWVIAKLQPGAAPESLNEWTSRIDFGLILKGWLALAITWLAYGASLWCVLRGLAIADTSLVSWQVVALSSLGACALAVVLGFVSMVPGGAGVRELVLSTILTPVVGPVAALCGALWLRFSWLVTELLIVAFLAALRYQSLKRPNALDRHSSLQ
jgi:glycosyltransferase 2 family protein